MAADCARGDAVIFGVHASVRYGLLESLSEARPLGVSTLQILPYRRHHAPEAEELALFRKERERAGVARLIVHSRFVPSLGSSDSERRRRSVELLSLELALAGALGAECYVLHAGAYSTGDSPEAAGLRLAQAVREAVSTAEAAFPILLENVPGGGRRMGADLEDLAGLLESLRRLGISSGLCLDTAHAWAAGYDVASERGAEDFLSRAESLAGASSIRLFHLNDTRAERGSRLESHWHWGEGRLSGGVGIASLLARAGYESAAAILETPKEPGADARNLAYVRRLARKRESGR
ncbi:MAG: TIM barrel protein [Elusimicrobia bacterium]|nr:TIM barrel protein [Elusimicrobiota bacterium]